MATTWNGTASDELVSGDALIDGASVTGLYEVTGEPQGNKMVTKQVLINITDIPTGNSPIAGYSNNKCVTKSDILRVY